RAGPSRVRRTRKRRKPPKQGGFLLGGPVAIEHDACALVAVARKDAQPTRDVLDVVLHGMACLAHRSGLVDGEGDGAGVLTDIPRTLWAERLRTAGRDGDLAGSDRFA